MTLFTNFEDFQYVPQFPPKKMPMPVFNPVRTYLDLDPSYLCKRPMALVVTDTPMTEDTFPTDLDLFKRYVHINTYMPCDGRIYRINDGQWMCHPDTYRDVLLSLKWQRIWRMFACDDESAQSLLREWMRDQLFDTHSKHYSPTLAAIGRDELCEACRGTKRVVRDATPKEGLFAVRCGGIPKYTKRTVVEVCCPECKGTENGEISQ